MNGKCFAHYILHWNVSNADSVELVGYGSKGMEGSQVVNIKKRTVFELKVKDAFGIQKKTLEIKTIPLPVIKSIMIPTPEISRKVIVQAKLENIQATLQPMGHIANPIDASRLALPDFEGIKVEIKEPSVFVPAPKFHLLQLDISRNKWWSKLQSKFRELNNFLQDK